jgi:hypothetical protein
MGALAYIAADRRSVKIHCLQFKPGGTWDLFQYTDPTLGEFVSRFYRGYDLVHVAWSPHGTDLLIIDSNGRIMIGVIFVAINRLLVAKLLNHDPEDNLNAVVGLKWINMIKRPVCILCFVFPRSLKRLRFISVMQLLNRVVNGNTLYPQWKLEAHSIPTRSKRLLL